MWVLRVVLAVLGLMLAGLVFTVVQSATTPYVPGEPSNDPHGYMLIFGTLMGAVVLIVALVVLLCERLVSRRVRRP